MRAIRIFVAALPALALALAGGCGRPAAVQPAAAPEAKEEAGMAGALDVAVMRSGRPSAAVSAFWNVDRQYRDAPTLTPHSRVVIADLKGPGVITLLRISHIPQIAQANLQRGIVLEVSFDGAEEPAVLCPMPDFFGDGCNGRAVEFASRFVEKVPLAWNAYFPMPFKTSAKVVFRNDTDVNATAYAYLEWERLPRWDAALGYFHATYRRKGFMLTNETREEFFRVKGRGQLLGRQFSIASNEPRFGGFNFIVEGNNEVDVDGRRRAFDYLGSEDSFTFSWGFGKAWTGPHAGMTHVAGGPPARLSIYRFHDHMPIRFQNELVWTIDWRSEDAAFGRQKGWVDYATVFYWYQDAPGGYRHEALPPVAERCADILPAPEKTPDLRAALDKLPLDPQLENTFSAAEDLKRVAVLQTYPQTHPFWIDKPEPRGGHPGQPNPGKRGILAVHAEEADAPALILRKATLPQGKPMLRVVVSGDPYEGPGKSDFLLRAGVVADGRIQWFNEEVIDAGLTPAPANWRTLHYPLEAHAGKTVGLVVKVSYGGPKGVFNEEAFFDEISVVNP